MEDIEMVVDGLSGEELVNYFCEYFYHDVESWFSADIACCENCYKDFLEEWPGAYYGSDSEFQKCMISVDAFYDGSSLQAVFTKDEYLKLMTNIHCPECGVEIAGYFWTYDLPFKLPDEYYEKFKEIGELAEKTPFLILSNSLAKETFGIINKLAKEVNCETVSDKYYRARKFEEGKEYTESDLKFPPREVVKEGRYNHAGFPVIYLGDSIDTCYFELRTPSEGIIGAEINITQPIRILDLIELEKDYENIVNVIAWSSLMASPKEGEGWYKPQYIFTRFVADCASYAGFDAIRYPSVRAEGKNNLVILDGINKGDIIKVSNISKYSLKKDEKVLKRV